MPIILQRSVVPENSIEAVPRICVALRVLKANKKIREAIAWIEEMGGLDMDGWGNHPWMAELIVILEIWWNMKNMIIFEGGLRTTLIFAWWSDYIWIWFRESTIKHGDVSSKFRGNMEDLNNMPMCMGNNYDSPWTNFGAILFSDKPTASNVSVKSWVPDQQVPKVHKVMW